jgi:hypothetical protein
VIQAAFIGVLFIGFLFYEKTNKNLTSRNKNKLGTRCI